MDPELALALVVLGVPLAVTAIRYASERARTRDRRPQRDRIAYARQHARRERASHRVRPSDERYATPGVRRGPAAWLLPWRRPRGEAFERVFTVKGWKRRLGLVVLAGAGGAFAVGMITEPEARSILAMASGVVVLFLWMWLLMDVVEVRVLPDAVRFVMPLREIVVLADELREVRREGSLLGKYSTLAEAPSLLVTTDRHHLSVASFPEIDELEVALVALNPDLEVDGGW